MLESTFSSKLDYGSYIISIAKTASNEIGAWFVLWSFFLLKLLCTICSCMEYCSNVWAGAPSCYLELLDKLQKQICRTVVPLEPLGHCQKVSSLSTFYRYYFGRCLSELAQLIILPFSQGRSTRYSDRLHNFSVSIPR